jgi:hypothetical protein
MRRAAYIIGRPFLLASVLTALAVHAAGRDELYDKATQIQFAFYAGDNRALAREVEQLTQWSADAELQAMQWYYVGYGEWKLAESMIDTDKKGAAAAAEACTETLEKAAAANAQASEVYAMQSACFDLLGDLRTLRAPFYALKSQKSLDKARTLGDKNPRVMLIGALHARKLAKHADEKQRAYQGLTDAVSAFDAAPAVADDSPDWGQAESLLYLGLSDMERGDALAARNALEHALVIAPDYRKAQDLLHKVSAR